MSTSSFLSLRHASRFRPAPGSLTPVRLSAEVRPGSAEIASGAAESGGTLGVGDRAAGVASVGNLRCALWVGGFGFVVAFSVASLAAGAAVEVLILELEAGVSGE